MVIGRTHIILVVRYVATRGRDRPSTSKVHVCVVRNMKLSQLTACDDIIGMLGDILSMDVYRSYPIVLHLRSFGMSSVACGNGLVASHGIGIYAVYFRWNDIFVTDIWLSLNEARQSQLSSLKRTKVLVYARVQSDTIWLVSY